MDLSAIQLPGYTGTIFGSCWTGQAWIVVGQADGRDNAPVFRSTDLINWTEIALPAEWGISTAYGLASDGLGRAVVVGLSGKTAYSTDHGLTWTYVYAGTTGNLYSVVYALGHFIHVGEAGILRTSNDGTSWTTRTSGATGNFFGIGWDGGDNLLAGGTNLRRINAPGSVVSFPDGNTDTTRPPAYFADENRFVFVLSSTLFIFLIPGTLTLTWIPITGVSSHNALTRPVVHGGSIYIGFNTDQHLQKITPDGVGGYTTSVVQDWQGNAIIGAYTGGVSENGIALLTGINGILYTSATQQVQGTITDGAGSPAQRTVRLYDRNTGKYLAETQSDPVTGLYEFTIGMGHPEVQRITVHDDTAESVIRNDLIDRVLPG